MAVRTEKVRRKFSVNISGLLGRKRLLFRSCLGDLMRRLFRRNFLSIQISAASLTFRSDTMLLTHGPLPIEPEADQRNAKRKSPHPLRRFFK